MVIPSTSTEYVHIPVALPEGVDSADTPVRVALVAHRANPADSEWHDAEWAGSDARILIGPDASVELAAGDYRVWINLDPPGSEDVVRKAGILTIT
ncbi:hypothetical protein ACIRU8_39530 [Streptomyces sp. NPDC101175]|uniref:hypothetical protein n=1 Tax=Streptomyces sp. NPDC101175 TaxID=3366123 RepID=UPI0038335370